MSEIHSTTGLFNRSAQAFGLGDQLLHCRGRRREQRLGKPDTLAVEFPYHVQGLVPFLGLEAVDRENDRVDRFVVPAQGLGVLLPRREHRLIALDIVRDPGFGEVDGVGVEQFSPDVRDRHVA